MRAPHTVLALAALCALNGACMISTTPAADASKPADATTSDAKGAEVKKADAKPSSGSVVDHIGFVERSRVPMWHGHPEGESLLRFQVVAQVPLAT